MKIKTVMAMLLLLVVGAMAVKTGEMYTTAITITSPVALDADWTDGNQTLLFGNWLISDSAGNVIAQGNQTDMTNETYTADVRYTFSDPGTYTATAMIVETHIAQTANGGWGPWSFPALVANKQVTIEVTGAQQPPNAVCGDGICDLGAGETADNCAADCGGTTTQATALPPIWMVAVGGTAISGVFIWYLYFLIPKP